MLFCGSWTFLREKDHEDEHLEKFMAAAGE